MQNIAAETFKLIAYGKVLQDDNRTLKDYGIVNGDFIDLVVLKVRIYQVTLQPSFKPKPEDHNMSGSLNRFNNGCPAAYQSSLMPSQVLKPTKSMGLFRISMHED
jgi:hypothetical protein